MAATLVYLAVVITVLVSAALSFMLIKPGQVPSENLNARQPLRNGWGETERQRDRERQRASTS